VLDWFKKQRESGCHDWFCLSTICVSLKAANESSKAVTVRRCVVKLWGTGMLDMVSPNLWRRYYRLNDKYLSNFKSMLK